jgi:formate C-acetyltransferase
MVTDWKATETARDRAWRGFKPGPWCGRLNVRDFIQRNYTP